MNRTTRRILVPIGALLALPLLATPAAARQDVGPTLAPTTITTMPGGCPLERVGTQLVRCDDLTGNGVPAPSHIPEH